MTMTMTISQHDRALLRDLARQIADAASLPVMAERRKLWEQHNSLQPTRPLMLVFPEGAWGELMPDACRCEDKRLHGIEWDLRARLYYPAHFQDDTVIEKTWFVYKVVHHTSWGLDPRRIPSPVQRGAWHFDPVIKEPSDLKKLRFPEASVDEKATADNFRQAQDLFGDILDVQLRGIPRCTYHLMAHYTSLRGLEEVMLDMYDNQQMLHDAMAFLTEGNQRLLKQYLDLNLLSLNNDGTYQNSGGVGYTQELPRRDKGFDAGRIRPCDVWADAESQEMTQVSPEMHAEFVLRYERQLLEPFGLTGYGCCDDLTYKLDDVCAIPNMRRISISPFANVELCAQRLTNRYILSWKPQPAHLVGEFNEPLVRDYIRRALDSARRHGCVFEMILKDTHTCEHRPERFDRWTRIARELIREYA